MKTAEQWLAQYALTHQNPTNRRIHKVCVPLIFWSVSALLWSIKWPSGFGGPWLNWASLILLPVLVFYGSLGWRYLLAMGVLGALCILVDFGMGTVGWPVGPIGAAVFVSAWIGQFCGHKVEGKKPAFFEDLQFLLIGPLWVFEPIFPRSSR
jgi:uncharacterized membrane protein YGL010W